MTLLGTTSVDDDATGQLLTIHSALIKYLEKMYYVEAALKLFIDLR
jgi:hypothetical protein